MSVLPQLLHAHFRVTYISRRYIIELMAIVVAAGILVCHASCRPCLLMYVVPEKVAQALWPGGRKTLLQTQLW